MKYENCRLSESRLIDCLNKDIEIIEEPKEIKKQKYMKMKMVITS